MIHYHGTPCGATREDVSRFLGGRHALIPWVRDEDIGTAGDVCQSFCLDNGAFTAWKSGEPITDWSEYFRWADHWLHHPGCDFAIIPDVIDGTEDDNNALLAKWHQKVGKRLQFRGVNRPLVSLGYAITTTGFALAVLGRGQRPARERGGSE